MKILRKLPVLLALLSLSSVARAATWYATSSSANINAIGLWVPTSTGSCTGSGTALIWGAQADGDVFNANGCTALAVNVDPGTAVGASAGVCGTVTVTVTLTTDTTNGGAFTYATATNIVIHANVTALKTTALTITGSTGGGTICGTATTGGNATNAFGVTDSHTVVTMYVVGNIAGGSGSNAYGYNQTGNTTVTIVGNVAAGTATAANGFYASTNANGVISITGNCTGSNTVYAAGCATLPNNQGTVITINGNIINGLKGPGATGAIIYTPGAATNYILYPKDASYTLGTVNSHSTEVPIDPGVGNVRLSYAYGTLTGTLSPGAVTITGGGISIF